MKMSNPAVIELIKTNLRNNDLSIEDNLGESIHLHLGYLRMDFTIKEYKDFCLLIRKTLDTMNINLDLHNILPFDLRMPCKKVRKEKGEKLNYVPSQQILNFFKLLNENGINYVIIKNDCNEFPSNVLCGDDVDILVHPDDYEKYINLLKINGYDFLDGENKKYFFLYNLRDDLYIKKEDAFFHAYEKLSCNSFTNMGVAKIPLDIKIQEYIWTHKVWDDLNNWYIMDDCAILLYLIVRSTFDKGYFRDKYIIEIEKRKYLFKDVNFINLCKLVYYKFTDELIRLLINEKYDEVFPKLIKFKNY